MYSLSTWFIEHFEKRVTTTIRSKGSIQATEIDLIINGRVLFLFMIPLLKLTENLSLLGTMEVTTECYTIYISSLSHNVYNNS
jgi:hypothetical protein